MTDECDSDFDGSIDYCELHKCLERAENLWRAEHCDTEFGFAYCPCDIPPTVCPGEINCIDAITLAKEIFEAMDTNNDGNINIGDGVSEETLAILSEGCDEILNVDSI